MAASAPPLARLARLGSVERRRDVEKAPSDSSPRLENSVFRREFEPDRRQWRLGGICRMIGAGFAGKDTMRRILGRVVAGALMLVAPAAVAEDFNATQQREIER